MKRKSILITEGFVPFENNRISATVFTSPGPVSQNVLDPSIHFGDGGTSITMQNLNILNSKIVKCSPDDEYDFEVGALIALMKMCGRDKVTKACDELYKDDNYKNALQEMTENCEKLMKENEKLQHEYDLCKNSENALKCSVDYLNKTIAKLNTAIYGYKEDLNKVTKRCEELEIKESMLNKQEEAIKKREEKLFVYFGGRQNGKQHTALVNMFKKLDQKKVDAAYKEAYNTTLPVWQKEVLKQAYNIITGEKEKRNNNEIKGRPFEDYFYEECDRVIKSGDEDNE